MHALCQYLTFHCYGSLKLHDSDKSLAHKTLCMYLFLKTVFFHHMLNKDEDIKCVSSFVVKIFEVDILLCFRLSGFFLHTVFCGNM